MSYVRSNLYRILFRLIDPIEIFKNWWVYPLNGQARRIYNASLIAYWLRPCYVIETGTYLGSSTWLFLGAPSVTKVFSIESNRRFHESAKRRLSEDYGNKIELVLGDSKSDFKKIVNSLSSDTPVLCYLDAHWEGDIPTTLELEALCKWGGSWVAIIDDFKIDKSDHGGFGYDKYQDLEVNDSIIPVELKQYSFVPNELAISETGARRGTAYIFSEKALAMFPDSIMRDLRLRPLQN